MSDAGVLLDWLTGSEPGRPVEQSGATAVFGAITGTEITAVMRSRRACQLTARQRALLLAARGTAGHRRRGVLYAGPDVPVAATTAVLVPARIPPGVRALLGIGPDGTVIPAQADMPLGRALAGFGVRREQMQARLTTGRCGCGPAGIQAVICSSARLWLGPAPVAVVTEHVLAAFVAAYPGPWDRP